MNDVPSIDSKRIYRMMILRRGTSRWAIESVSLFRREYQYTSASLQLWHWEGISPRSLVGSALMLFPGVDGVSRVGVRRRKLTRFKNDWLLRARNEPRTTITTDIFGSLATINLHRISTALWRCRRRRFFSWWSNVNFPRRFGERFLIGGIDPP